jgi:iron complex transport system ATP-binding protein
MTAQALAVESLDVSLGGRRVLQGLSLSLQPGQLVALVGPNGTGKTTLARAIAGLLPAGGRITLGGSDLSAMDLAARARLVAYLPQGHQVHWPLPARDVVALGRFPHGARDPARLGTEDARRVREAMERTGTLAFADRPVQGLSGGERARVMLARVLACGAPVILADEPTAALDPRHQLAVMQTLQEEARRGALVLAVTHDLPLAMRFAASAVVMHQGAIVASGPPAGVLDGRLFADVYGVRAETVVAGGVSLALPWEVL